MGDFNPDNGIPKGRFLKMIGRNDPCSCGSEKKYKKCCLSKDLERVESNRQDDTNTKQNTISSTQSFYSDLDLMSNEVMDLIRTKEYSKAKEICRRLLDEYPDQVDGIERFAFVYEAEGNRSKSAEYFHKAADFMRANGGFAIETIEEYLNRAKQIEEIAPKREENASPNEDPS